MERKLSISGIYRLALYSRHLYSLNKRRDEYISSQELGDAIGHTATQVRKDLTCYGSLGEPGKGYKIEKLNAVLSSIFGRDKIKNVVLVGVGNLGMALIAYKGFKLHQFRIFAAFDKDIRKIGRRIEDVLVYDIQDLKAVIDSMDVQIAIVAVPSSSAQEVIDMLVSAGIKAILNFAPTKVNVPDNIKLQNVDVSIELDRLYYLLKNSF